MNLPWAPSSWQLALHLVILGWRCLSFASLLLSRTESSFPIRRVAVPLYNSLVYIQHILSFREEGKQHERTYLFCLSSSSLMLDATWIVARSARLHAPRATDRVLKTANGETWICKKSHDCYCLPSQGKWRCTGLFFRQPFYKNTT